MSLQALIDIAAGKIDQSPEAVAAREIRLTEARARSIKYDAEIAEQVRRRIPDQECLNRSVNFGALYD